MNDDQLPDNFKILMAEDDSLVRLSVGNILRHEYPGSTVLTAENGQVGLDLFRQHSPDIVITDINMPVMDGIEMAKKIRQISSDARFIVVSGYCDKEKRDIFNQIGCVDYIVKPLSFYRLFAAIEKCRAGKG
jgi:YesN/AraC family two-component response regulator